MVAAATSGGLPLTSRRSITLSMFAKASAYRARPCGLAASMAAAASRVTLSAAPLLMLAGSTRITLTPPGAELLARRVPEGGQRRLGRVQRPGERRGEADPDRRDHDDTAAGLAQRR